MHSAKRSPFAASGIGGEHPSHQTARMWKALFFAAMAASPATGAAPGGGCPASVEQTQLALSYDAFDSAGWRDLIAQGCTDAAVATLKAYFAANEARMTAEQARELQFHIGQTLAFARRDAESIPYFEKAVGGDAEWSAYVDATLAFLKRDAKSLTDARARYASAPNASQMRLAVIDGFIACADKSYVDAAHCGMKR
jgi:hypothetical protein